MLGTQQAQLQLVFLTSFLSIAVGWASRRLNLLKLSEATGLKAVLFNVLLPILILQNQWMTSLEVQGLLAFWAAVSQVVTFAIALACWYLGLMGHTRAERGLHMLACIGGSMGFPLALLGSSALQHGLLAHGMSYVLAFDLAGNTWSCQVVSRLVAARDSPKLTSQSERQVSTEAVPCSERRRTQTPHIDIVASKLKKHRHGIQEPLLNSERDVQKPESPCYWNVEQDIESYSPTAHYESPSSEESAGQKQPEYESHTPSGDDEQSQEPESPTLADVERVVEPEPESPILADVERGAEPENPTLADELGTEPESPTFLDFVSSRSISGATGKRLKAELTAWRLKRTRLSRRRSNSWSGDMRVKEMLRRHRTDKQLLKVNNESGFVEFSHFLDPDLPLSDLIVWLRSRKDITASEEVGCFSPSKSKALFTYWIPADVQKIIFNTVLLSFIVGFALNIGSVPCPEALEKVLSSFGAAFSPLLMFLLGMQLELGAFLQSRYMRRMVLQSLLARTVVSGLTTIVCCWGMRQTGISFGAQLTFAVCLLSPVTNMHFAFATEFGYDANVAALVNTFSNLTSFAILWIIFMHVA